MNTQELAQAAIRLKNDVACQEALSMLREMATKRWEQATSVEAREQAWQDRAAVGRLETALQTLIDRGVVDRITEERASARK